jgi:hypothetical protein
MQMLQKRGYYDVFYVSTITRIVHQHASSICSVRLQYTLRSLCCWLFDRGVTFLQPPTGSPLDDPSANFWLPNCPRAIFK